MIDLLQSAALLLLAIGSILLTRLVARQRRRVDALVRAYARSAPAPFTLEQESRIRAIVADDRGGPSPLKIMEEVVANERRRTSRPKASR